MKKETLLACVLGVSVLSTFGCQDIWIYPDCKVGEKACDEGVLYECTPVGERKIWKKGVACEAKCSADHKACEHVGTCADDNWGENGACTCPNCVNGCKSDGTCICSETCVNGCEDDGLCRCPECVNGCGDDGKCTCSDKCVNGCFEIDGSCKTADGCRNGTEDDGTCLCLSTCVNGCEADGSCIKSENCVNGVNENGSCKCPECVNGCGDDGTCTCSDKCVYGCYEIDGRCKTADGCRNGTNDDGTCTCPGTCVNGCETDGSCKKTEGCVNGVAENGACICSEACVNGCNENGSCKCDMSCTNGCNSTGETCCKDNCQNGCDASGLCLCPKGCVNGCDQSGKACCPDNCKKGCDIDNRCSCPGNCINGCNDDGSCKASEGCKFGVDENGACKCSDKCDHGCNIKGECMCVSGCMTNQCDAETGNKCACDQACVEGSTCDSNTGLCKCLSKCNGKCDANGDCEASCINVECNGENEKCKVVENNPECVNLCKDVNCEVGFYCSYGNCLPKDKNNNHLDDQYETASNQNKLCFKHADCASGSDEGFCDSFMGYKCSTKCTRDEQCVDDKDYHYICRSDGRCAPDSFVTVWEISKDNEKLTLPVKSASAVNCTIDWGDNSDLNAVLDTKENITHKYSKKGEYTIKIKGQYDGFSWPTSIDGTQGCLPGEGDSSNQSSSKLKEVKAFGPVGIGEFAFALAENLTKLSQVDIPDASKMSSLKGVFCGASQMNYPVENWDISHVTDLYCMFTNASKFNQPLDRWDVSQVTKLVGVFWNAGEFNQPLNSWDTSKVENTNSTFSGAKKFNQPLDKWDMSHVSKTSVMFQSTYKFNQNISMWKLADGCNVENMFYYSGISNENLCKIIKAWTQYNPTNSYGKAASCK